MSVTLSDGAVRWLAHGRHGISSKAMFTCLALCVAPSPYWRVNYPHDIYDFRRCEVLLRQAPELRGLLPRMSAISPQWAALVDAWSDIVSAAEYEVAFFFDGARGTPHRASAMVRECTEVAT